MTSSDIQALRQALRQLGSKKYKVIRKSVRGFNDKGRPDSVELKVEVEAVIQPKSKRVEINSEGNGEWVTTEFDIVVVEPDFICADDLFITDTYGTLRIASLDDTRFQGAMSASAVRENATGRYLRSDNNI